MLFEDLNLFSVMDLVVKYFALIFFIFFQQFTKLSVFALKYLDRDSFDKFINNISNRTIRAFIQFNNILVS